MHEVESNKHYENNADFRISTNGCAKLDDIEHQIHKNEPYMMVEWHIYASVPTKNISCSEKQMLILGFLRNSQRIQTIILMTRGHS